MEGNVWLIIKLLPYLGFCSLIAGFVGWHLRAKAAHAPKPVAERDGVGNEAKRWKQSQQSLREVERERDALKKELAEVQKMAVKAEESAALQQQMAQNQTVMEETQREVGLLRAELQKAQEQLAGYHAKSHQESKEQRERMFSLENELSQARAELLQWRGADDETGALRQELERARESVAQATRFAGELRKREAGLLAELEVLRAKTATPPSPDLMLPATAASPLSDSDVVRRARAEVAAIEARRAMEKQQAVSDE